jgi:glycosyltransferase involved in cell wall biosynthesis
MNLVHYMRKEKSGLAFTTLELVQAEEKQGHGVCVREPTDKDGMAGTVLYGNPGLAFDVELIHSQMPPASYHNRIPKFMWMHGEPLSSVGNGVSMKAIVDMAPKVDAFIAMRKEEHAVWASIKRTYIVQKGIDLDRFHPIDVKPHDDKDPTSKLSGEPAVLYLEHWRGQRNPLYLCVAMEQVWQRYPKARLHLFNCTDQKMLDTFKALFTHNKWWTFLRSLNGPVKDHEINALYNRADIVVSGLYPLYARSIEAFGAGKAFIGPGYTDPDYPWHCALDPDSMAEAICACWENYGKIDYRAWAEQKHDVMETVRQSVAIYERYMACPSPQSRISALSLVGAPERPTTRRTATK